MATVARQRHRNRGARHDASRVRDALGIYGVRHTASEFISPTCAELADVGSVRNRLDNFLKAADEAQAAKVAAEEETPAE